MLNLRDQRRELLEHLKEQLSVIAAGYPAAEIGHVFEEAASCFQAVACSNLLVYADVEGYGRNLIWAGFTRRYFLRRCHSEGSAGGRHAGRSRCESFFCAIAAGDEPLAQEIGDLSPPAFLPDGEYEDDFAYYLFVHLLLAGGDASARETALSQLERALEGQASPRLKVCRALHAKEGTEFDEAFVELVEARAEEVEEMRARWADDVTFEARSRVFVEGLALLRLAEQLQLTSRLPAHPLCPSLARLGAGSARPDDLLAEIDRTFRG